MSDIRKGDLVMVVKPTLCCGFSDSVGRVFLVVEDHGRLPLIICDGCGYMRTHSQGTTVKLHSGYYCHRSRLKRLPGLEELERNQIVEELTA